MKRKHITCWYDLLLTSFFLVFLLVNLSFLVPGGHPVIKLFRNERQTASPAFSSDQLKEIYQMLPAAIKTAIDNKTLAPSTTYLLNNGFGSLEYKIKVRVNKYGQCDHLGLQVFDSGGTENHFNAALEFIEREFLVYLLSGQNKKIINRMNLNKVKLSRNGIKFNSQAAISSFIICNTTTPFSLKSNSKMFYAIWRIDSVTMLTMEFPNDYIVISGKRKDELEKELERELKNHDHYPDSSFQKAAIIFDSTFLSFFRVAGNHYAGLPGFSSDYFIYSRDSLTPVFDSLNCKESTSNLLLNIIPTNKIFQIRQKLYANKTEDFSIYLNDFYNFFHVDYQFFLGWQSDDVNELKASIIIQSTYYAYIHLLIIETDKKSLFSDTIPIRGTFYAFIPTNNLKQK